MAALDFQGQTVWVTGAGKGIGYATALAFVEAGARVSGFDLAFEGDDYPFATHTLDVANAQQVAEVCGHLLKGIDRLDVLVNNAGAMNKAPFLDLSFDDWRHIFTVDVDGAFLCSQIAARQMVKQGEGGRIVNITSVHEHTPLPDASAYTAAKHALGGLTKSMALELVKHKILVNAVAPGAIATPMNDMDDSEVKEGAMPEIPLARPGHTKEIASLVAWLCDSDASYTTGQSFIVDGGFMLANPQFKPAE